MRRGERGFTLLELLLAVGLLAMLMVLLTNSIGLVSHRLARGTERKDRTTTVALVQNYLRAALGQALPVAVASDNGAVLDFDGSADRVSFISRAPTSARSVGMVRLSLRFDPGKGGAAGALVIDWQPYGDVAADETRAGTRGLLTGVAEASFAYFDPGAADRPGGWRAQWHDMPVLPALVRISLAFSDGQAMPALVAALRLANPAVAANPVAAAASGSR